MARCTTVTSLLLPNFNISTLKSPPELSPRPSSSPAPQHHTLPANYTQSTLSLPEVVISAADRRLPCRFFNELIRHRTTQYNEHSDITVTEHQTILSTGSIYWLAVAMVPCFQAQVAKPMLPFNNTTFTWCDWFVTPSRDILNSYFKYRMIYSPMSYINVF